MPPSGMCTLCPQLRLLTWFKESPAARQALREALAGRGGEELRSTAGPYRVLPLRRATQIRRSSALIAVRRLTQPSAPGQELAEATAAESASLVLHRGGRNEAISQFEAMLRIADDAEIRTDPSVPELKELGSGFLDLSRAMPAAPKPAAEAAPAAPSAARSNIIVPPTVIQQRLPPWVPAPGSRATAFRGAVRVQISAEGKVTSAAILKSVHPAYDHMLLRAARGWSYEPARKDGAAIPVEKTVEVTVAPPAKAGETDRSQTL